LKLKLLILINSALKKVGHLAKKYRLIDLSDDILNSEFKTIRDKYKKQPNTPAQRTHPAKKNS